jgi:hypothetical protein
MRQFAPYKGQKQSDLLHILDYMGSWTWETLPQNLLSSTMLRKDSRLQVHLKQQNLCSFLVSDNQNFEFHRHIFFLNDIYHKMSL